LLARNRSLSEGRWPGVLVFAVLAFGGLVAVVPGSRAGDDSPPKEAELRIAFVAEAFPRAKREDVVAAVPVYIAELNREVTTVHPSAVVVHDPDDLTRGLQAGQFDMICVTSIDYVRHKAAWNVDVFMCSVEQGFACQSYLVLARDPDLKTLSDLNGKQLLIPERDELAAIYLESEVRKVSGKTAASFFGSLTQTDRAVNGLMKVMLGKADACLVKEGAFETMREINPQVGRQLHVLARSAEYPNTAMACRVEYPGELKARVQDYVVNRLHLSPRGRQILMLFRIDAIASIDDGAYDQIRELLREHDEMAAGRTAAQMPAAGTESEGK
jgi:ABC-type phosphate/phosphonate transport system substrate-binding protein